MKYDQMFELAAQLCYEYLFITTIIVIYPLTARVVGAPQMISHQFPPFFPVLHCPLGHGELQAYPFPNVVHPTPSSVCLFFFPLSLCLERWYWSDLMNGRHDDTSAVCVRRSSCGPIACWILARTSSLVTWFLYEIRSILR